MITNEEFQISNKSYVNKDFQTIYPELVQYVQALTKKWDPETTNESDPLLVLLKEIAFLGDKLSYNTDKNILETYLPSATQETSFRNILDTNGYTMKYYQSATTEISVAYTGSDLNENQTIVFKPFETQFTDIDNSVVYTLVGDAITLSNIGETKSGVVAEGTYKDLEVNGSKNIQLSNLDDNNRLFLPERIISETNIYVKNNNSNNWKDEWYQVSNLNTHRLGERIFKFGFDSNKNLPYIQFPSDVIELIGGGINVRYFTTSGVKGNIKSGLLTQLCNPSPSSLTFVDAGGEDTGISVTINDELTNVELLKIYNYYSSTNGKDPETLNEAYINYKKIVGTFDTLVTCRDFSNYMYNQLDKTTKYPLISNIQVSDRRTDINYSLPVISFNGFASDTTYKFLQDGGQDMITPFDVVLYPLNYSSVLESPDNYDYTFTIGTSKISNLINSVYDSQSVEHTYLCVGSEDLANNFIYLILNNYSLDVKISTIDKVNSYERVSILSNVYSALYKNFNSRELDYGEEIPYDSLYETILNADTRIKNVSLAEPKVNTSLLMGDRSNATYTSARYENMLARNILAGKVSLFEYDNDFNYTYNQTIGSKVENIEKIDTRLGIAGTLSDDVYNFSNVELQDNMVVQLMNDSYSTSTIAVTGVNYWYYSSVNQTIPENTTYKITSNDKLYLSTTSSDGVLTTYEYGNDYIKTYDKNGNLKSNKPVNENIIRPNFDLNSWNAQTTQTSANISVIINSTTYSFDQLDSSQQIEFLNKNSKQLKGQTYIYWFTNNDVLFASGETERVLGENEYFVYTDSTKTQLEVFGSGTKLTRNASWTDQIKLNENQKISIENLTNMDLATYNSIPWIVYNFDDTNKYITITEQQIITLTKKDKFSLLNTSLSVINNTLVSLNLSGDTTFEYTLSDSDTPTPVNNVAGNPWKIRTRLDINSGPDLPQKLTTSGIFTEQLYINGTDTTPLGNTTFKLSKLVQMSGGNTLYFSPKISLINYSESTLDTNIEELTDGRLEIVFSDLGTSATPISLVLPHITNEDTMVMVYYDKKAEDTITISNATNKNTNASTIQAGVNTLVLGSTPDSGKYKITFTITKASGSQSALIIDFVKVSKGINSKFKLGVSNTLENTLNTLIASYGSGNQFYYTYNVPNAELIDVNDFTEPNWLWDKNNVYNKFTLAKIDFSTSNIDIAKSSLK